MGKGKIKIKLREFWEHLVHKDEDKTPETPPPKEEAPAVALTGITVTGEGRDPFHPKFAAGAHEQLSAEGFYTDGSKKDLTAAVEWSSSAPAVASIDAKGKAAGKSAGNAKITAKDAASGVSDSVDITVTEAVATVLKSIKTPAADLQKIGLQVHATTFRGQVMEGFHASATLSASGAKAVHCPSDTPVSGGSFAWTDLWVKAEGKVEFSVKPLSKNGAAPRGSASYKLSADTTHLIFDAEQQDGAAMITAKTREEAIEEAKKVGAKETMGADIDAIDQGNGRWEVSWGTDDFDLKPI